MKRIVLVLFMIFSLQIAFSQEFEMIRHEVQMGETVRMLSKKYHVEPSEIYRLNKFAVDGIRQGMVLQIMAPKKETPPAEVVEAPPAAENSSTTTETAQSSDDSGTTTTTTKKVTTTVIKKKKPSETQPAEEAVAETAAPEIAGSATTHTVLKGETMFSIARKYNILVDDLKQQNEKTLKKGLQPGQILAIVSKGGSVPAATEPKETAVTEKAPVKETPSNGGNPTGSEVKHTVAKGETFYSLSKRYNVTVDEIKAQNEQALKKGLQVGLVLTIRANN